MIIPKLFETENADKIFMIVGRAFMEAASHISEDDITEELDEFLVAVQNTASRQMENENVQSSD